MDVSFCAGLPTMSVYLQPSLQDSAAGDEYLTPNPSLCRLPHAASPVIARSVRFSAAGLVLAARFSFSDLVALQRTFLAM